MPETSAEELAAGYLDDGRALARQIDRGAQPESGTLEVAKLAAMARIRLLDDALRARLVQKHEMQKRRQPGGKPTAPAAGVLADDDMAAPVVIACSAEAADNIFLGPIDLEIAKGRPSNRAIRGMTCGSAIMPAR